jgi:hypothetical protein
MPDRSGAAGDYGDAHRRATVGGWPSIFHSGVPVRGKKRKSLSRGNLRRSRIRSARVSALSCCALASWCCRIPPPVARRTPSAITQRERDEARAAGSFAPCPRTRVPAARSAAQTAVACARRRVTQARQIGRRGAVIPVYRHCTSLQHGALLLPGSPAFRSPDGQSDARTSAVPADGQSTHVW